MITINSRTKEVIYNPEYYVMKHYSHFIKPNAHKLQIADTRNSELAFRNKNGAIILLTHTNSESLINSRPLFISRPLMSNA